MYGTCSLRDAILFTLHFMKPLRCEIAIFCDTCFPCFPSCPCTCHHFVIALRLVMSEPSAWLNSIWVIQSIERVASTRVTHCAACTLSPRGHKFPSGRSAVFPFSTRLLRSFRIRRLRWSWVATWGADPHRWVQVGWGYVFSTPTTSCHDAVESSPF